MQMHIVTPQGVFKVEEAPSKTLDYVIQRYAQQFAPKASVIYPAYTTAENTIGIFSTKEQKGGFAELEYLKIDTHFVIVQRGDETYLTPSWRSVPGSVRKQLKWEVPEWLRLFIHVEIASGASDTMLFAIYNGETYKLPLANIFPDGRVCMGRDGDGYDWEPEFSRGIIGVVEECIEHLQGSEYNNDLNPGDVSALMFKWNVETLEQIFPEENERLLTPLSSPELQWAQTFLEEEAQSAYRMEEDDD